MNEEQVRESQASPAPRGSFTLSMTSVTSGETLAKASLTCGPAGGSHPNPEAACAQLSRVDGRIEDVPEDPGPCTLQFDPVIVSASGSWRGEERRYEQEFSNRCVAIRQTGGVIFDLTGTGPLQDLNPQPEPPG